MKILELDVYEGRLYFLDVYKMNEESENVIRVSYGRWNKKTGLSIFERSIFKRRSNFQGHELR